jgi:hypothetical protein
LLATIVGWSLGIIAGLAIGDWVINSTGYSRTGFVDEALLGCSIGLFNGIFQKAFLQRHVVQSGWWIIASAISWTITILLYYPGWWFSLYTIGLMPGVLRWFSLFTIWLMPGALTGLLIIRWFCFPMGRVQITESI